jgi:geranylgeranyl transferase type-2 subunit beta
MPSYLEELTGRLAAGLAKLPLETRSVHAAYLKSAQRADGGFAGRAGESDLYYTGFALRSLALLGELDGPAAERAGRFLHGRLQGQASVMDLVSLIFGAAALEMSAGIDVYAGAAANWAKAVAGALERFRRGDGGYAKTPEGAASSTYHTFLVLLCQQLLAAPLSDPERVVGFLLSQQSGDGGFREIRASKRASTNPTAAAIGSLRILDALSDDVRIRAIDFLAGMQTEEGGLRANTRIPVADLLSTFTAAATLADLDALEQIDIPAALRYAKSLQWSDGGFQGAVWDEERDVEYTFYGLGCLSLLDPRES